MRFKVLIFIVMILAFGGYIFLNLKTGEKPTSNLAVFAEIAPSFNYPYDSKSSFYYNGKNYFHCTKDGFVSFNNKGSERYNVAFTMNNPILKADGNIIAVSEERGNSVYIFDDSGLILNKNFENPVLGVSVSRSGLFTVLLQKDSVYELQVYEKKHGAEPIWSGFFEDHNIFPLNAAISNDGRILAVNLLDASQLYPYSKLVFYYTNASEGRSYEDTMFASKQAEDVIGLIKFVDNNNLFTVSAQELTLYSITESVTKKWAYEFKNRVSNVAFMDSKGIALTLDESIVNKSGEDYKVIAYNISGNRIIDYLLKRPATYLSANADGLIVGINRNYYALNTKNSLLWEYIATFDIRQIFLTENLQSAFYVAGNEASGIKRTRVSTKTDDSKDEELLEEPVEELQEETKE